MKEVAYSLTFLTAFAVTSPSHTAPHNESGVTLNLRQFGADETGVRDSTIAFNDFLSAVPDRGSTAIIPKGRYLVSGTLWIKSRTQIVCEPGATLIAGLPWHPPARSPQVGLLRTVFTNQNYLASKIADADFSVRGCSFDLTTMDAGSSAVFARMATGFRFIGLTSFGGGNLSKVMASTHYEISNNRAFDSTNACYGQFEQPAHFVVTHNYCRSAAPNAILVTGTNFDLSGTGKASDGLVEGNTIEGGLKGGGQIWINGLGRPGSGSNGIRVINNQIDSGAIAQECVRISGASDANVVQGNTCLGGTVAAIAEDGDSGGLPTNTVIEGNTILLESLVTPGGGGGIIKSVGTGTRILNNKIESAGSAPAGIRIGGTRQIVTGNIIGKGPVRKYITSGASEYVVTAPK